MDFCAINAVVYGDGVERWAMTEWPREQVERSPEHLRIGDSSVSWQDGALVIKLEERTSPWRQRLTGVVRLTPQATFSDVVELDGQGRHRWYPVAPLARIDVALEDPALSFSGSGYHDANAGSEGLEDGFVEWTWSRATGGSQCSVLYDALRRDGTTLSYGRRFAIDGSTAELAAPRTQALPSGRWGVFRRTRTDAGGSARLVRAFEDTPFYTRSLIEAQLAGVTCSAVHESLSLDRFRRGWVRFLLPFKIRRRPG